MKLIENDGAVENLKEMEEVNKLIEMESNDRCDIIPEIMSRNK